MRNAKDFKTLLKKLGFNSIGDYAKYLGYSNTNQLSKPSYKKLREKLVISTILEHFKINALELFEILDSHREIKKENELLKNKLDRIKKLAGEKNEGF